MKKCVLGVILTVLLGGCNCGKHEKPSLLVINLLDADLYADCHIKGSINVPFETVEQFVRKFDKKTPIVVYCSNYKCTASSLTARLLTDMGFNNVWAYEAGMAEWYQQGLPVEGACKQAYLTMINKAIEDDKARDIAIISTDELQQKMYKTHQQIEN